MKQIKALLNSKKFEKALEEIEAMLKHQKESPYLWNLRGDIIQLLDSQAGPPLSEAAKSYKTALRLNSNDLETIQALAHFYDAVDPKPRLAKHYANLFLKKSKATIIEMKRILSD